TIRRSSFPIRTGRFSRPLESSRRSLHSSPSSSPASQASGRGPCGARSRSVIVPGLSINRTRGHRALRTVGGERRPTMRVKHSWRVTGRVLLVIAATATAATRLISQEKVVAITGEFHSSVFLAEMEVAHKAGIPIIAVDVWALKITAKGYPEVFRVAPNQALIATKYGDWMAAAGFKNVAVMFE